MRLTTNQPETAEPVMKPEVAAMIESWRPRFPRPADVADVEVVLPTVQKWVAATVPQTPGTAALLMRQDHRLRVVGLAHNRLPAGRRAAHPGQR